MSFLPRRLRRPRAELTILAAEKMPSDDMSGGSVCISVTLTPGESFPIERGRLELLLEITHFSRTVLDGYHEHSYERVCQAVKLCGATAAQPGVPLAFRAEFRPDDSLSEDAVLEDARPLRLRWVARARFKAHGYREISASRPLHPFGRSAGTGPVVDGTGFLPLRGLRPGAER